MNPKNFASLKTNTNAQLSQDHLRCHQWWGLLKKKKKTLAKDEIIRRHNEVVKIMINRGMTHNYINDLDATLPKILKQKTKMI